MSSRHPKIHPELVVVQFQLFQPSTPPLCRKEWTKNVQCPLKTLSEGCFFSPPFCNKFMSSHRGWRVLIQTFQIGTFCISLFCYASTVQRINPQICSNQQLRLVYESDYMLNKLEKNLLFLPNKQKENMNLEMKHLNIFLFWPCKSISFWKQLRVFFPEFWTEICALLHQNQLHLRLQPSSEINRIFKSSYHVTAPIAGDKSEH